MCKFFQGKFFSVEKFFSPNWYFRMISRLRVPLWFYFLEIFENLLKATEHINISYIQAYQRKFWWIKILQQLRCFKNIFKKRADGILFKHGITIDWFNAVWINIKSFQHPFLAPIKYFQWKISIKIVRSNFVLHLCSVDEQNDEIRKSVRIGHKKSAPVYSLSFS